MILQEAYITVNSMKFGHEESSEKIEKTVRPKILTEYIQIKNSNSLLATMD